ncbi:MAG: signal peptide peptidase SppA [Lentimicrobiaceae bacterium]|jgi:protease-4|nr:signal peptide peptidase SppA [Lentimicrobiaceae bacterium]
MKTFFKSFFASFLGMALLLLVLFFFLIGTITALVATADGDQVIVKPKSVLVSNFDFEISDRTSKNTFSVINPFSLEVAESLGMNDIIANIKKAATDSNIEGIYMNLSSLQTSFANIEEIRNELLKFKESGKFIISYSEGYSQGTYYLATVSDKIYLNPHGNVDFKGLISKSFFLKGLLEKLDVEMQIVRGPNNKFKSAVEPYILDKMSEANREQTQKLISSIWEEMLQSISKMRNIDVATLNRIADDLEINFAEDALRLGFVDGLMYKDELVKELRTKLALPDDAELESVKISKYTSATIAKETKPTRDKIAVIYAIGSINSGTGSETEIGSEGLSKAIRNAAKNEHIKAIVLRVNSPGGSALASEVIRRELEIAASKKPLIVSMGNVAASGGYWISTASEYIFADPTTITGSIGVFGMIPNAQKLLNNKLGITFDNVTSNKNSDFADITQPLSDFQYKKLQNQVVKIYDDFIELVATSRKLRPTFVDSIGQGRVWSGTDALKIGLVDQLGGLEQAIAYAAEKVNLENYKIIEFPEQKTMVQSLLDDMSGDKGIRTVLKSEFGAYYPLVEFMNQATKYEGIQARMPFYMILE